MLKNPRNQIILIAVSTALAFFSLVSIVKFTDPYSTGLLTHSFFYLSLLLVCLGGFTVVGITLRQWLSSGMFVHNLSISFRQALLASILVTGSLMLQAEGLLYWWVELTLILFLVFLEAFLNLKV